ncbi:hypothetical protein [Serratia fonticola]
MAWFWSGKKTSWALALLCTGAIVQSKFPETAVLFSFLIAAIFGLSKED